MKDYLIVGLGISGASLAYHLEQRGRDFIIFDDDSQEASRVAGGLMNPVVLKRFTLAWRGKEMMNMALTFYKNLEEHLNASFLKPVEIYRKFYSIEEQNEWFTATDKPGLSEFLSHTLLPSVNPYIPAEHSFGRVLSTARIDTTVMLDSYSAHLKEAGKLLKERFQYDALVISEEGVAYKHIQAKNIIFCDGFGMLKNPYLNYLPLRGNKGEYIIIKAPDLKLDVAVKSSVFIFPVGPDLYAVGATYNNNDKTPEPTRAAREELKSKLKGLVKADFEVVDQVAGLRPATVDRRPLVGQHPRYLNLYCSNGFGSRGILTGPTVSEELLNHIERGQDLSPEIDLKRFTKRWFPKS